MMIVLNRIVFVSLVVSSVPFGVVFVDVFTAMGGVLAADDHQERAEDGSSGDDQIHLDPEVAASVLNHCVRDERRNFGGLLELATPDEQSLLKGADFVGNLTKLGDWRNVSGRVGHEALSNNACLGELRCHFDDGTFFEKTLGNNFQKREFEDAIELLCV